jgi:hypothetical protein
MTDTILQRLDEARRATWAASRAKLPSWRLVPIVQAERALAGEAIKAFAKLNGWRRAPEFYDLDRLGRGAATRTDHWNDDGYRDRAILDHPIWFYSARRFVAAVGQPYPPAAGDLDLWRTHLADRGLVLHVPPDPLASIHYPGGTIFVVVTKPGVEVRFLPEQDGRLADLWKRAA